MESAEWEWGDTKDSWIWDVPNTENDGEKSSEWEWGDSNDLWIWDDLQYGGKKRKADDEASTPENFYTNNEVRQVKAKKYRTTAVDYSVRFNDLEDLDLIREYERTQQIFEQLLNDVTQGMRESDLVRFVLRMDQLDIPISLPFMPVSRFTPERVFSQIEHIVQSKQELRLN